MSLEDPVQKSKSILCRNCRYYQITWDAENPYGCTKFGFKTTMHPADYIIKVSGQKCHSFRKKY